MAQSSIDQLRMNYRDDVSYTLSRIKTRCPLCYIALAGPEMIGEGPLFPVSTSAFSYLFNLPPSNFSTHPLLNHSVTHLRLCIPFISLLHTVVHIFSHSSSPFFCNFTLF